MKRRNPMSKMQTIMVLVGLLGAYATVSGPSTPIIPDIPDIPNGPVIPDTPFPSTPTNPSVLAFANQITARLSTSPQDALVVAKTFQDWGVFLVEDRDIRNTGEFREVFINSTKTFFAHTGMVGKYPGLDSTISSIITESLRNSHPSLSSGKENVALNSTIREAYRNAMNAVAWGAYQAVK
jgi:fluoride ion exporter CrcB/FEX